MSSASRAGVQISLSQLGKLVAFCAILAAGLTPLFRSEADRRFPAVWVLWTLPPVLAVAARLMMRRGPIRGWVVAFLLCLPITVTMAAVEAVLVLGLVYTWGAGALEHPARTLVSVGGGLLLGYGILTFVRPFLPIRCPACARWSSIRPSPSAAGRWLRLLETRWCLLCQKTFRRIGRGPWEPVLPGHRANPRHGREGTAAVGGPAVSPTEVRAESHV